MTSPHLADSLRKYSAKASSAPGTGCTAKRSRYLFWNSGSLTIFCTSALTFLMMCVGVPAAANSPNDTLASYPGTVSAMVGTSGNCGTLFSLPEAGLQIEQRVTVVLSPHHGLRRDRISSTAPVFHDDALLPHFRQLLCNGAGQHVG